MKTWIQSSAIFSPCEKYRYVLHRQLSENNDATCLFIMLNPSTADAHKNDPTVERCERFTREWGYTNLVVCNIFALRSTDPKSLYSHDDPIGPNNNGWILEESEKAKLIVCAWGNHGQFMHRGMDVLIMLKHRDNLRYLTLNKSGQPKHPLYIKADTKLQRW